MGVIENRIESNGIENSKWKMETENSEYKCEWVRHVAVLLHTNWDCWESLL